VLADIMLPQAEEVPLVEEELTVFGEKVNYQLQTLARV